MGGGTPRLLALASPSVSTDARRVDLPVLSSSVAWPAVALPAWWSVGWQRAASHPLAVALFGGAVLRLGLWPLMASAGIVLGLAALTRSVLFPFGIAAAAFLVFAWRGPLLRRATAAALLLAATGVTLAPWAIRNTSMERTLVVVDSMGGRNLMLGNYEFTPLYRMWDAVSLDGDQNWYSVLSASRPEELETQGQIDQLAARYGLAFAISHPVLTLERDAMKFFDLWSLERELIGGADLGYFGSISTPGVLLLTAVIFGSYTAGMLLGIFEAIMAPPADRRVRWFLFLLIGFYLRHPHTYLRPFVLSLADHPVVRGERRGAATRLVEATLESAMVAGERCERGAGVRLVGPGAHRRRSALLDHADATVESRVVR